MYYLLTHKARVSLTPGYSALHDPSVFPVSVSTFGLQWLLGRASDLLSHPWLAGSLTLWILSFVCVHSGNSVLHWLDPSFCHSQLYADMLKLGGLMWPFTPLLISCTTGSKFPVSNACCILQSLSCIYPPCLLLANDFPFVVENERDPPITCSGRDWGQVVLVPSTTSGAT